MKETILSIIFIIHATAFAYLYGRRGHRVFHLLFSGGFVLLAAYYGYNSWQFFAGVESGGASHQYMRWAGLSLCAVATPFFLVDLFCRIRNGRRQ